MARRSPGSTSTCSASMLGRQAARQHRNSTPKIGGLNGAPFWGEPKVRKSNLSKGISEMAMSRLVPLLEFNPDAVEGGRGASFTAGADEGAQRRASGDLCSLVSRDASRSGDEP